MMADRIKYDDSSGRNVIVEGWVAIDGVKHFVSNGFISCDRSLNSRSWRMPENESACLRCQSIEIKRLPDINGQLKMF